MNAEKYYNLGSEKYLSNQYAEAIEYYDKAIELENDFELAIVEKAACKAALKDYTGALADYKMALSINPNNATTYINAGMMLNLIDSNNKDSSFIDKALELDNKNSLAHYMKGLILANGNMYEQAIEYFTNAIELDSTDSDSYCIRGCCYKDLKIYDKALADFKKADEIAPNNYDDIEKDIKECEEALRGVVTQ